MRASSTALLALALALSACGEAADGTVAGAQDSAAPEAVAEPATVQTAAPADAAAPPSESDRLQLAGAEAACRSGDFNAFLFLYAQSTAVQARYTAAEVSFGPEGRSQPLRRAAYLADHGPAIRALDHSFYTAASVQTWEANPRAPLNHIVHVVNTASDNRRRVEWSRARFDGEGEEGPGRPTALVGEPGALLFRPVDGGCWELAADYRPSLPGSITLEEVTR